MTDTLLVLGAMVSTSVTAMVWAYRLSAQYARGVRPAPYLGADLLTYDGLRALMCFAGWMAVWSLAALLLPCWFLEPEHFVGLWLWVGAPIAILCFLHWLSRHEKRRQALLEASRPQKMNGDPP